MGKNKKKNSWDLEFKINAVNLYRDSNKSYKEIENNLGIPNGSISRWNHDIDTEEINSQSGKPRLTTKDEEILRLKRENLELKQEKEILKKSVAIFLKPQK